jgi:hypothetical protein
LNEKENVMNAAKKSNEESAHTSIFDPFPEPQTMPKKWEVSGFISREKPPVGSKADHELERKYRYPGIMYD